MRWSEHVTRVGAKRNAYKCLVGKPEARFTLYGLSRYTQEQVTYSSICFNSSIYTTDEGQGTVQSTAGQIFFTACKLENPHWRSRSRHGTVEVQSRAGQIFFNVFQQKYPHYRSRSRHGTVNSRSHILQIVSLAVSTLPITVNTRYSQHPVIYSSMYFNRSIHTTDHVQGTVQSTAGHIFITVFL